MEFKRKLLANNVDAFVVVATASTVCAATKDDEALTLFLQVTLYAKIRTFVAFALELYRACCGCVDRQHSRAPPGTLTSLLFQER